jgi:uncharacterized protein
MVGKNRMKKILLHGRKVYGGIAEGEAIVSSQPISFCAGLEPLTGEITERRHVLKGQSIAGKVLVFPFGKGSSAFSKAAYATWLAGKVPIACILGKVNPQTALASIVMHTPAITELNENPIEIIDSGDWIKVDADKGIVEIIKRAQQ